MDHPMRADADALQARLRAGGWRMAVDDAHAIMADCDALIGRLMAEIERLDRLVTCDCGDQFTTDDPGACGRCRG